MNGTMGLDKFLNRIWYVAEQKRPLYDDFKYTYRQYRQDIFIRQGDQDLENVQQESAIQEIEIRDNLHGDMVKRTSNVII
jgi:hypothetical protein